MKHIFLFLLFFISFTGSAQRVWVNGVLKDIIQTPPTGTNLMLGTDGLGKSAWVKGDSSRVIAGNNHIVYKNGVLISKDSIYVPDRQCRDDHNIIPAISVSTIGLKQERPIDTVELIAGAKYTFKLTVKATGSVSTNSFGLKISGMATGVIGVWSSTYQRTATAIVVNGREFTPALDSLPVGGTITVNGAAPGIYTVEGTIENTTAANVTVVFRYIANVGGTAPSSVEFGQGRFLIRELGCGGGQEDGAITAEQDPQLQVFLATNNLDLNVTDDVVYVESVEIENIGTAPNLELAIKAGSITAAKLVESYIVSPSATTGQYLTFDGTNWIADDLTAASLPDQTGNANKFLKTDGTTASWETLPSGEATTFTSSAWIENTGTLPDLKLDIKDGSIGPEKLTDEYIVSPAATSGQVLSYDGTAWIAATASSGSHWGSGVSGTTLPDGTTDLTENTWRNGNVGINTDPVSTLDVSGSIGLADTSITTATYIASNSDYHINLSAATAQVLTLPAFATTNRREYRINCAANNKTFAAAITRFDGTTTTVVPYPWCIVKNDGSGWRIVEEGGSGVLSEDGEQIFGSTAAAGSFTTLSNGTFTLPTAGRWEVTYHIFHIPLENTENVQYRILKTSNSTMVAGSLSSGANNGASGHVDIAISQTVYINTTGAETFAVQGFAAGSELVWQPSASNSKVIWKKIGGFLPVLGTSLDYVQVSGTTIYTLGANGTAISPTSPATVGNIPYAAGVFTLEAGKTYRLEGAIGFPNAASDIIYQWRDITNSVWLGVAGTVIRATAAETNSRNALASAIFTPSVSTTVRLQVILGGASSVDASGDGRRTFMTITQLGSSATTQFTGATAALAGTGGFVPAPAAGQQNTFLQGNGTWGSPLPSQSGNSGRILTTNGTTASWSATAAPTYFFAKNVSMNHGTMSQFVQASATATVTGAAVGDNVIANPRSGSALTGFDYFAFVSAANTVTIWATWLRTGSGSLNTTWDIMVLR